MSKRRIDLSFAKKSTWTKKDYLCSDETNKSYRFENNHELSEIDFYPPADDRFLESYLEETYDGEFANYCEDFFELLEKEEYYD